MVGDSMFILKSVGIVTVVDKDNSLFHISKKNIPKNVLKYLDYN